MKSKNQKAKTSVAALANKTTGSVRPDDKRSQHSPEPGKAENLNIPSAENQSGSGDSSGASQTEPPSKAEVPERLSFAHTSPDYNIMAILSWGAPKDLDCFIRYDHVGEENVNLFEQTINDIAFSHEDYASILDRAVAFLWPRPNNLNEEVLSLLSIEGKIKLLRQLFLERSNEVPTQERLGYLARFSGDLERYAQVEKLRDKVLIKYMIDPEHTWLRELVDLDEWLVTAGANLEESLWCEYQNYITSIDEQHAKDRTGLGSRGTEGRTNRA